MTRWTAFAGIVGVLLSLLLALTRSSAKLLQQSADGADTDVDAGSAREYFEQQTERVTDPVGDTVSVEGDSDRAGGGERRGGEGGRSEDSRRGRGGRGERPRSNRRPPKSDHTAADRDQPDSTDRDHPSMEELSGLDPSDIPRGDRRGSASSGPDDRWQETTGSGDRWTDPDDSSDRWTEPTVDDDRDESLTNEDRDESLTDEAFDNQPDGTDLRDITDPSGDRSDDTLDRPGDSGASGLPEEVTRSDENRSMVGPADSYGFEPPLPEERTPGIRVGETELTTRVLLLNVVASQLLFAGLLVGAVWWTGVPASALGLTPIDGLSALAVGTALGVGLWLASETGSRLGRRLGLDASDALRDALAPSNRNEWILLLGVVLPVVALFEEFLFRSVLIGAVGAGFDLPAWALVVGSSVVFALAHSAQGYGGIAVTGLLGAVLGTAFVATGSFLVVVLAHYLVNALEFVVHESNLLRTIARWRVRRRLGG